MNIQNHIALDCPCTSDCPRHSDCAACVDHHHAKGNLPFCLRDIRKKLKEERKLEKRLEKHKQ